MTLNGDDNRNANKRRKYMSENRSNELVPVEITVESLKAKIYMIRGQRVMLATDLAEIYGYTTNCSNMN